MTLQKFGINLLISVGKKGASVEDNKDKIGGAPWNDGGVP